MASLYLPILVTIFFSDYTQSQYIFIHDALNELIKFGNTSVQAAQLPSLVLGFDQDKTLLNDQFKV